MRVEFNRRSPNGRLKCLICLILLPLMNFKILYANLSKSKEAFKNEDPPLTSCMKFLMPLLIIIPRKCPPTLPTLERSLARMTPQMALQMKAPRKPLITQIALPAQFRNHLRLRSEGFRLVRSLGMKHLLVLLEILIRGESEFSNRAFREEVVGGPIVEFDVLIAGLGCLVAFVEVEVV